MKPEIKNETRPLLGVIGGLGPMATAVFLERIVRFTDARTDQEHIDIAIRHCPSIPDRTEYILGRSDENPLPQILREAQILRDQGAGCIAIPCITAHSFHDQIEQACALPVIDTVSLTAKVLLDSGVSKAAVWATEGTMHVGLFQAALSRCGIGPVVPDPAVQQIVTDCIYRDIKSGREPDRNELRRAEEAMWAQGADAIILGCTELSVAAQQLSFGPGYLDALDVLTKAAVESCGANVRREYQSLFVPLNENSKG